MNAVAKFALDHHALTVLGVDFTSAPTRKKPIVCAAGQLTGQHLKIASWQTLPDFTAFEAWLAQAGPLMAGFDFPFGQPRTVIEALGWGTTWADVVANVRAMSMADFLAALARYRDAQPPGKKQPLRVTDALAGAISPMMVYGVPVGRMFFQGAPRLDAAGWSIWPCQPRADERVALEVYPALMARRFIGKTSYKSEARRQQTPERQQARDAITRSLMDQNLGDFGLRVHLADGIAERCVSDASGDTLDAVLATVQAAWAVTQPNYGVPAEADPLEGWIADPALLG